MDYRPGENIPGTQYRFTSVLGEGGHGTVYGVEHTFLQAPAVMKLLHADLVDHAEISQRMTVEARTLAKLRHPNIVEVTDGGLTAESPKRPYFVMEPLNGMTLRDMRRHVQRGIGYLPALRLLVGILEGLEHAHRNGVIHRDIKPDNIFLHRTSTDLTIPKILDFGIAHLLMGKGQTGKLFIGTPRYAAPEQLKGDPPSPATDVYAAGLVLWELVTGEPPFHDINDITALMVAHMTRPMPLLRTVMSDAPAALEALLVSMLEKEPSKRPQSAFHAAVALREARAIIEREQAHGIDTPDFLTEPTPMDNILIGASPADAPVVAATRAPSMIEIPPTEPGLPPSFPPVSGKTEIMPNRPSGPPKPFTGPLALESTEYGAPPKKDVDRAAETRAAAIETPSVRVPKSDTEPLPPAEAVSGKPSFTTSHGIALPPQNEGPLSRTGRRPSIARIMMISALVGAVVVAIPFVIFRLRPNHATSGASPPVAVAPPSATEPPKAAEPIKSADPVPSAAASVAEAVAASTPAPPASHAPRPKPAKSAAPLNPTDVGF